MHGLDTIIAMNAKATSKAHNIEIGRTANGYGEDWHTFPDYYAQRNAGACGQFAFGDTPSAALMALWQIEMTGRRQTWYS